MRMPGYKFCLVVLEFVFSLFVANSFAESIQFSPVVPEQKLVFPQDYGAHPDFRLEWWYATGWLETPEGNPLGFQITFFRTATGKNQDNPSRFAAKQLIVAHVALSDPSVGKLLHDEKTVREGFDLAYAKEGDTDVRLDDWYLVREADGRYEVDMQARDFGLKLTFTPTQMMMRQGDDGFSRKGPKPAQASYYYSEPHLQVRGSVTRNNKPVAVSGSAWLDHEWSSEILDPNAVGWDWVGANLDDGSALMAFQIRHKDGGKLWAYGTLRDAAGHVTQFNPEQVEFTPLRTWQSPHTDAYYPVVMHLRVGDVEWQLMPLFDDQELDSRQSIGSAYWEGAVTLMRKGQLVGRGYLELTGYVEPLEMKNK